jgi:hypothetical protein
VIGLVAIPRSDAEIRVCIERDVHGAASDAVVHRVVDRVDALRVVARHTEREVTVGERPEHGGVRVRRAVAATSRRDDGTRQSARATGEDLDHARDGVRAVQHARGAAHDFDALDVVGGQGAEIHRTTGIVHRDAVDQHFHVLALAAAQKERRVAAERAGAREAHARKRFQGGGERRDPTQAQLLAGDDIDGGRGFVAPDGDARRRDDHRRDARGIGLLGGDDAGERGVGRDSEHDVESRRHLRFQVEDGRIHVIVIV